MEWVFCPIVIYMLNVYNVDMKYVNYRKRRHIMKKYILCFCLCVCAGFAMAQQLPNVNIKQVSQDVLNAARTNNMEQLETLFKKSSSIGTIVANTENNTDSNRTPLMYAAWNKNLEMVDFLLSKGAAPNTIDKLGNTALSYALIKYTTTDDISENIPAKTRIAVAERLISGGAKVGGVVFFKRYHKLYGSDEKKLSLIAYLFFDKQLNPLTRKLADQIPDKAFMGIRLGCEGIAIPKKEIPQYSPIREHFKMMARDLRDLGWELGLVKTASWHTTKDPGFKSYKDWYESCVEWNWNSPLAMAIEGNNEEMFAYAIEKRGVFPAQAVFLNAVKKLDESSFFYQELLKIPDWQNTDFLWVVQHLVKDRDLLKVKAFAEGLKTHNDNILDYTHRYLDSVGDYENFDDVPTIYKEASPDIKAYFNSLRKEEENK